MLTTVLLVAGFFAAGAIIRNVRAAMADKAHMDYLQACAKRGEILMAAEREREAAAERTRQANLEALRKRHAADPLYDFD